MYYDLDTGREMRSSKLHGGALRCLVPNDKTLIKRGEEPRCHGMVITASMGHEVSSQAVSFQMRSAPRNGLNPWLRIVGHTTVKRSLTGHSDGRD